MLPDEKAILIWIESTAIPCALNPSFPICFVASDKMWLARFGTFIHGNIKNLKCVRYLVAEYPIHCARPVSIMWLLLGGYLTTD